MTVGKRWQLWVGLTISVLALVLAVRQIDLREVADNLAQAEFVYLLPAALGLLLYLLARGARWRAANRGYRL